VSFSNDDDDGDDDVNYNHTNFRIYTDAYMRFCNQERQRKTERCLRYHRRCMRRRSLLVTQVVMRMFKWTAMCSSSTWLELGQKAWCAGPWMTWKNGTVPGRWAKIMDCRPKRVEKVSHLKVWSVSLDSRIHQKKATFQSSNCSKCCSFARVHALSFGSQRSSSRYCNSVKFTAQCFRLQH